jgi:3',5'-cyclic AMP phosphodiesterase CpdA
VTAVRLVQLSDLHFGVHCDLAQIDALERAIPALAPTAIVVAGDVSQRARHGELQAGLRFIRGLERRTGVPSLVIPGNHDVEWWTSPFNLLGERVKYVRYRRWFGEELAPWLDVAGARIVGVRTAHGVHARSMTPNLNDMAVKGHLDRSETERAAVRFAEAPAGALRVMVMHQNLLPGQISRRYGLARPHSAQRRVVDAGTDLVLCGHDHQEDAKLLDGVVVATTSTHTNRTRGGRPSAFNLIEADATTIAVTHQCWDAATGEFRAGEPQRFPRRSRPA